MEEDPKPVKNTWKTTAIWFIVITIILVIILIVDIVIAFKTSPCKCESKNNDE